MDLSIYLRSNGIQPAAFAEILGVRPQTIYRYLTRERMPRRDVMEKIHQASAGHVTANDFFSAPQAAA